LKLTRNGKLILLGTVSLLVLSSCQTSVVGMTITPRVADTSQSEIQTLLPIPTLQISTTTPPLDMPPPPESATVSTVISSPPNSSLVVTLIPTTTVPAPTTIEISPTVTQPPEETVGITETPTVTPTTLPAYCGQPVVAEIFSYVG
jgi:hypothetical protein